VYVLRGLNAAAAAAARIVAMTTAVTDFIRESVLHHHEL